MKEQTLLWVKAAPGKPAADQAPDVGRLRTGLEQICRDQGWQPGDFLAALGPFGSWLMPLRRAERTCRLVWNGRERRLLLEGVGEGGSWTELARRSPEGDEPEQLLRCVDALLEQEA